MSSVRAADASSRFMAGPAAETTTRPRRPHRKRLGSTGITPQAMPMMRKTNSDVPPMWTSGLAVRRLSRRGVSSPCHNAAHPWASSCIVIEKITQKIQLISSTMRPC